VELLDRYLYEVRRYLPAAQQDDIIAEISDAIQSQAEEREQQLGRALTAPEESAVVKAFGHPKLVAARYQPAQYLIGPEIYPFYWYTLKIALAAVLGLELLGALIAALLSPAALPAFIKNISVAWPSIFLVFGVVTFIFVALERTGSSSNVLTKLGINRWNPRALPRAQSELPRFSLLIEAAANVIFMLWLLDFVPLRRGVGLVLSASGGGKALAPLALTANWHILLMLAFIAAALIVAQDFILLLDPTRVKLRAATLLLTNLLLVGGCIAILPSHAYVTAHSSAPAYVAGAQALNQIAYFSIAILALACGVAAGSNIRNLLQRSSRSDLNISYQTGPN